MLHFYHPIFGRTIDQTIWFFADIPRSAPHKHANRSIIDFTSGGFVCRNRLDRIGTAAKAQCFAVQIAVAVSISCFLESPRQPVWGLLAAPIFLIHAGAYIYWRPVAFWIAAQTIILLHFFYNALVFIGATAERLHR
jgi:hypothetical protein